MVKRPTPYLDKLIARIRRQTKARGAKAALADVMGIPPQRLHEWLSGSIEPGGETTLQLLQWVTAAEAKQKETAAMLQAPRRRVTRSAKVDENKVQPDRSKR